MSGGDATRPIPDAGKDVVAPQADLEDVDVLDTSAAGGLVISGGVLRFGGYVTLVALSVISAAVLTRYLGTARFGQYTTVTSVVGVIAIVTDAGMSALGVREYSVLTGASRNALMRDLLGLRLALTLVGVLFTVLFALLAGYDAALVAGALLASLGTISLVLQHTLSIPLAAELRLGALSALDVIRQALAVVAIVVLVALGSGLLALLAVNLLVYTLLIPITAKLANGEIPLLPDMRPHRWAALLRLTVSFSLASAVGTVYAYTAQILTSLVASGHQSGLFAVSFRVYIVAATIPGLLVSGALPLLARAARDDRERLAYATQRIFEVSLVLGIAVALGIFAGADFIVHVLTGPKFAQYAGTVPVMRIQGAALIASFLLSGWGYALLSIKRYRVLLIVNLLAFAVSAGLTLLLAHTHGARGAAVATVAGETVLALGYVVALAHGRPELRPSLARLPRVLLAAAPAIAIALLVKLPSLPLTVIVLVCYGALVLLTRAIPPELTALIPLSRFTGRD